MYLSVEVAVEELYIPLRWGSSNTYLSVEVAVEEGDEEALEGDQEVGGVGPQAELHHAVRRGVDQVHDVRDAQQGEQHNGRLYRFPTM